MVRFRFPLLLAMGMIAAAAPPPAPADRWYGVFTDEGARIGHASREIRELPDGREVVRSYRLRIQEADQPATSISERTALREDRNGRPVSLLAHSRNGQGWSRSEAIIRGGRVEVTRRTRAGTSRLTVPLPAGVRFDDGEGLLSDWDAGANPKLEFDAFSLAAAAVERVVIAPYRGAVRDGEGRLPVLRLRYHNGDLRGVSRLLLDRGGEVLEAEQPMFGSKISLRVSDRETALRRPAGYSALRGALVRAPYRVPAAALRGRIRYRFGYRDDIVFPLPETGEQHVLPAGDGFTLDICAACGPGLPTEPAALADALRPTEWLQSSHPRLRGMAGPVARLPVSQTRKMELLAGRTRGHLPKIDFTGHFSALEALSRRSGDCTEAAVLLAALGRAAGIPTRIASGLVYSREQYHGLSDVFMPHSWVLAYVDGRWRSFDAALETFDATHVALTIGDGDPRSINAANQLAGLLEWRGMAEVRVRPAS